MKAIVVGAGGTSRELLRRLGEQWDVVLIDVDEANLDRARGIREFERVVGDGSSSLVLKRAGLDEADALVAASDDDEVNLEAVRIAQEAGLLRVVAVAAHPERAGAYRDLDVPVIAPDSLTARNIEVRLEPRRIASTAFADGKAEAIEFHISPDSPVRGKALRELHSETWIVAAILRKGALIVPHGNTTLDPGDRVTVVGSAADFSRIVKTFTAGESRFPLTFGKNVVVGLDDRGDVDGPVAEAESLVRNSQAENVVVVHPDPAKMRDPAHAGEIKELLNEVGARAEGISVEFRPVERDVEDALLRFPSQESCGVLVVQAPPPKTSLLSRFRAVRTLNRYVGLGVPVLFSRGTHPYAGVLVPARRTEAGETAGRAAIDLAYTAGAVLHGIAAVPPAFVSTGNVLDEARRAAAWLREEAAVQGVQVRRKIKRGNPVRTIDQMSRETSLVVLAMPNVKTSVFRPSITALVLQRTPVSVLLVPLQ